MSRAGVLLWLIIAALLAAAALVLILAPALPAEACLPCLFVTEPEG